MLIRKIDVDRAIELRALGYEYAQIAIELGVGIATAYCWCNPNNAREYRIARQCKYKKIRGPFRQSVVDPIDVAARLAEIPVDTRDLTAVVFGDPLPGRSALDKMRAN